MDEILKIISQAYSKNGYKIERDIVVPVLNRKITTTININCTSPTKFVFTTTNNGGSIKFEPGVTIHIPMLFGMETTLTQIDFDTTTIYIHATGCPVIHIPLNKV